MLPQVNIKKLNPDAKIPVYGTEFSAGADLAACISEPVSIGAGETKIIGTGLAIEIPVGYAGLVYARSGLAGKKGLAPANKVGVIDADYRGELLVCLHNHSHEAVTVENGDRIAQLVITPFLKVSYNVTDTLTDTARGEGGFGSTGVASN